MNTTWAGRHNIGSAIPHNAQSNNTAQAFFYPMSTCDPFAQLKLFGLEGVHLSSIIWTLTINGAITQVSHTSSVSTHKQNYLNFMLKIPRQPLFLKKLLWGSLILNFSVSMFNFPTRSPSFTMCRFDSFSVRAKWVDDALITYDPVISIVRTETTYT